MTKITIKQIEALKPKAGQTCSKMALGDCRNYSYFFQKIIKTLSRMKNADLFQYNIEYQ